MFNRPVEEKKVARFQKEMEKCLEVIENIWLDHGKKDFITGPNISVADLLACCELEQPGNLNQLQSDTETFTHPILCRNGWI